MTTERDPAARDGGSDNSPGSDGSDFPSINKTQNSQTKIVGSGVSSCDALADRSIGANCRDPSGDSFFDHGHVTGSFRDEKRKGFRSHAQ
jgi:hypothetical protein